jgi:hypothetical protein
VVDVAPTITAVAGDDHRHWIRSRWSGGTVMNDDTGGPAAGHDDDMAAHDRRYKLFAIGLAVVVLAFAAISITVVVMTST